MDMAVKRKNRILAFVTTVVVTVSLSAGLLMSSMRDGETEVYSDIKTFFSPTDPDAVFYDEATRTTINYEVEDTEPDDKQQPETVDKSEIERIDDTFVAQYFLDYLSDAEQNAYHQLFKGITQFEETINIENNVLRQDDIGDFIVLFTSANPYVNYLAGNYTISLNKKGFVTSVNVGYSMPKEKADAQREELDRKIKQIIDGMNWTMGEYEKVKYLHDYIVKNCVYDDKADQPYSAYGCLVDGKCVCEGYAKALLALCDKAGIKAVSVVGKAGETGEGQGHIWNKVMINDKWYDFDVTWDDPVSEIGDNYVRYDYFALCDDEFERNHTPDKNRYMNYPNALSGDADYFVMNDLVCDDGRTADETMEKAVEFAVRRGDRFARIKCTDKDAYEKAYEKLFDSKEGTSEMFRVLNKVFEKRGMDKADKYSIIKNDEVYTITVRFDG